MIKRDHSEYMLYPRNPFVTSNDFAELGTGDVAYIKKIQIGGLDLFAVTAANGALFALAPCRKAAVAKVMESDLKLVNIH